jgi:thioredoxin 1
MSHVSTQYIRIGFFSILFCLFSSCKKESLVDATLNNIPDLTSLEQVQDGIDTGVSVLFFYNSWSKNCLAIRPAVETLSADPQFASVFFGEISFDSHRNIASFFVVRGFPTILLFKNGREMHRFLGSEHAQEDIAVRIKGLL